MLLPIKNIIGTLMPSASRWEVQLLQNWELILGDLKTHVVLEKIHQNTLLLGVYDASWLQELYILSPVILETINKNLDQSPIKQLRFKQIKRRKGSAQKNDPKPPYVHQKVCLTKKQESALEKIIDTELKTALHNFLVRCSREST
jgi:hypothetical protein